MVKNIAKKNENKYLSQKDEVLILSTKICDHIKDLEEKWNKKFDLIKELKYDSSVQSLFFLKDKMIDMFTNLS